MHKRENKIRENKIRKNIRRAASLLLVASLCLTSCRSALVATTMELNKIEGTVDIFDGRQREIEPAEQLSLYSGYLLGTHSSSYAWINLDKVKLTKMDADSEIELKKKKNDLEILVNSGKLFFHITEPLEEEESLNIRTSSMVAGIRGTCGWMEAWEEKNTRVYILEGTVGCVRTASAKEKTSSIPEDLRENPSFQGLALYFLGKVFPNAEEKNTAANEEIYICAGQMAELIFTPEGDAQIIVSEFDISDIPAFIMEELREDEDLLDKIVEDSGLDIRNYLFPEDSDSNQNSPGEGEEEQETEGASFFLDNTVVHGNPHLCRINRARPAASRRTFTVNRAWNAQQA